MEEVKQELETIGEPQKFDAFMWTDPIDDIYRDVGKLTARKVGNKILIAEVIEDIYLDKKLIPVREYDTYKEANAFIDGVNFIIGRQTTGLPTFEES